MENKKKIEKEQLVKFISNDKLKFQVYDIEESETPDFILKFSDKIVSIELTRLINPKLQKVEKYKETIIENAHAKFKNKYSEKLYALFTFNNIELKAGKIEENKYSDEIFNLMEEIYTHNKKYDFNIDSRRRKSKFSELIESFSVNNTMNFSNWQHFGAYLVEEIDFIWLQKNIKNKEDKLKQYKVKFDENWLLLVTDFGTKASTHGFNKIDNSKIQTDFDNVFLYSYSADLVEILK